MIYVATLVNQDEMELLKNIYKDHDIPCWLKHRESGEFMEIYTGTSMYGIDIYVPQEEYEEAKAIYDAFFSGDYEPAEFNDSGEDSHEDIDC